MKRQRVADLDRRSCRRILWKIFPPDKLELVEIGGIDEMDVGLEHAVERAAAFGEDRLQLFQAVAGLRRNQRRSNLAQTFVDRDRVTGFVDRID
jgi:hypothetical protein